MSKLFLVTGANRGIGREIVRQLAVKDKSSTVILTSRTQDGKEEAEKLHKEDGLKNVVFHELDVTKDESVQELKKWIEKEYGGLDVLINNAGYASKGPELNEKIVNDTIGPNYYGVKRLTAALLPLLRKSGRILNVSSGMGNIGEPGKIYSESIGKRFHQESIKESDVDKLAEEFKEHVIKGDVKESGWPESAYRVSKACLNAYTRALYQAHQKDDRNLFIATICPGWVKTRMGGENAHRDVAKGAETPVWLATTDVSSLQNAKFWRDQAVIDF